MQTNKQFRRWTDIEEQQLLKEVSENTPIYIISKCHDRSKKSNRNKTSRYCC